MSIIHSVREGTMISQAINVIINMELR